MCFVAGIHNLHGMPGILGALAGVFMALLATPERYGSPEKHSPPPISSPFPPPFLFL